MTQKTQMPIDHFSYSSLAQLLRNPLIWKMKYVLNYYDRPMSVSAAIGRAGHKALEVYYGSNPDIPTPANPEEARQVAREHGRQWLQDNIHAVDFGKTGSPESMYKTYEQAMDFFFAEEPTYHEVVAAEEKISEKMTYLDGTPFPLPASGIPDVIERTKEGKLRIIDYKFTRSHTSHDQEDPTKILQAMFMFYLVRAKYGEDPVEMVFYEIKTSKNKDGSPQLNKWAVPYSHEPYHVLFFNLYNDAVKYLRNNPIFLPNIGDMFDGEQAWLIYSQGLISTDMDDVEVLHKVQDVSYTTKKFMIHPLDRAENKDMPPEHKVAMVLSNLGMPVLLEDIKEGPQVLLYRYKVAPGIKFDKFKRYKADIQAALESTTPARILAPIPGTRLLGVEVSREKRRFPKYAEFMVKKGTLQIPVGMNAVGDIVYDDLRDMPHLLIAGSTGAGKSVLLHNYIRQLAHNMDRDELTFSLIDPKRVELSGLYKLTKAKIKYTWEDVIEELLWWQDEMERRYDLLERAGKRDITEYNHRRIKKNRLPYHVIVIDEFADLILKSNLMQKRIQKSYNTYTISKLRRICRDKKIIIDEIDYIQARAKKQYLIDLIHNHDAKLAHMRDDADVEMIVTRLAQMGRAAGIHIILATQRPSVDVITGLIKANFPTRIALRTASAVDSKVILDEEGAEHLLGKGDLLYKIPSRPETLRLQGLNKSS